MVGLEAELFQASFDKVDAVLVVFLESGNQLIIVLDIGVWLEIDGGKSKKCCGQSGSTELGKALSMRDNGLLWMRTCHDSAAKSDPAKHQRSLGPALPAVDIQVFLIARQHLDTLVLEKRCIDKDTAAVVIGAEGLRNRLTAGESIPVDLQPHSSGARLARIAEASKGTASARAGEESQLTVPNDFHARVGVAHLEFTAGRPVVATGAEAKVGTAAAHKRVNDTVPVAIEDAAIVGVGTTGDDEQRCSGRPRLFEQGRLCQGNYGVIRREQAAQRVETLPDRGDCCASACGEMLATAKRTLESSQNG